MITAKEAAELVEISKEKVEARLERISEKIKDLATIGKRELNLSLEYGDHFFMVKKEAFYPAMYTPAQQIVIEKLTEHPNNYIVKIVETQYDLNKGFGSMAMPDDPPQRSLSYHIVVYW